MLELREYQVKALEAMRTNYASGLKKGILAQATGSGKTCIALKMVESAINKDKRVAFLVDRLTLLQQTCEVMYNAGIEFGVMQANNPLYNSRLPFQICTSQTLARRKVSPFDFLIYDEAHVLYRSILKLMKSEEWQDTYFCGLTATPFTRGLGKHWQFLVNGTSVAQLIREGFLSKYKVYGPSVPDLKGVGTSAGDYNKKELSNRVDKKKLIGDIVENWFKLSKDKQTIVAGVDVAHAEHLAESFSKEGIKADVVHCYLTDGEVQQRVRAFRNGDLQVLSSVDMLSRGMDLPQAETLIIARPTKSLNYHLQLCGRILRPLNGETKLILDHAGNINRLGWPCDEFNMDMDKGDINRNVLRRKSKEALPKPCPKCKYIKRPHQQECPVCGFKTKKQSRVEVKEAALVELQKKRHKETPLANKEKFYAKLLAGARAANFKDGWAAHKYREYYGTWPSRKITPDKSFQAWLEGQPRWKVMKIIFGLLDS